jgi:hypothetical protein
MEKTESNINLQELLIPKESDGVSNSQRIPKTSQKQRESALAYYYANRDAVREHYKNLPADVKERRLLRTRLWRSANKSRKAEYDKNWRVSHREEWLALAKKQRQKPESRFKHNLRKRLRDFIRIEISGKSPDYGCTAAQLRAHIERQFQTGMSWSNYGEWHVDHIVPCKIFDLELESHRLLCFNWQNLRPLPGKENMRRQASFSSEDLALLNRKFVLDLKRAGVLLV